jgi:hypothetical protein
MSVSSVASDASYCATLSARDPFRASDASAVVMRKEPQLMPRLYGPWHFTEDPFSQVVSPHGIPVDDLVAVLQPGVAEVVPEPKPRSTPSQLRALAGSRPPALWISTWTVPRRAGTAVARAHTSAASPMSARRNSARRYCGSPRPCRTMPPAPWPLPRWPHPGLCSPRRKPADLLPGLGEWTVGDHDVAVVPAPDGGGRLGATQPLAACSTPRLRISSRNLVNAVSRRARSSSLTGTLSSAQTNRA